MIERRNFYRILHVQPDASIAVIRESYRVLMQANANLANEDSNKTHWGSSLLNIAYKTLQDNRLRKAYDLALFQRYPIKILSLGAFGITAESEIHQKADRRLARRNRRNYYRILQVQPDAPNATISASYRILKQNRQENSALLDEAYRILSNPTIRQQYDAIFSSYTLKDRKKSAPASPDLPITSTTIIQDSEFSSNSYQISNFQYCAFCNTPYVPQIGCYQHETCLECASPLQVIPQNNPESSRRLLRRTRINGEFSFYIFWPSNPYQGILQDLSATGIRFITHATLNPKDIIKIDAPNFQAVAEVTYTLKNSDSLTVGTRFIAAKFDQRQGNFVVAQA